MLYIYFSPEASRSSKRRKYQMTSHPLPFLFFVLFFVFGVVVFSLRIWNVFQCLYLFLKPFVIINTYLVIPLPYCACILSSELRIWKVFFFSFFANEWSDPINPVHVSLVVQILVYNFFTYFDLKYILFIMIQFMFHVIVYFTIFVFDISLCSWYFYTYNLFPKKRDRCNVTQSYQIVFHYFLQSTKSFRLRTFYCNPNLLSK